MTPDQIALVSAQFAAVDHDRLGERFYAILFERWPAVRPLFSADVSAQRKKLVDELASIVAAINDLPSLEQRARDLGERHVEYGAQVEHYGPVGEALIAALGEVVDGFDDAAAEAWVRAYWLVAEAMLEGDDHARFGGD